MNHQAAANISRDNPSLGLVRFDILQKQKEWDFSIYALFLEGDAHASPVLLYTNFGCIQGQAVISLSLQTSTLLKTHNGKEEIFILTGPQNLLYPDWILAWIPQNHIELPHHLFLLLFLCVTKFRLYLPAGMEGKFNMFLSLEQQNTIFINSPENPCNTVGVIYGTFRKRSYS